MWTFVNVMDIFRPYPRLSNVKGGVQVVRAGFSRPKVVSEQLLSRAGYFAVVGFFLTAIAAVLFSFLG